MSVHFSQLAEKVAADRRVDVEEVMALRRSAWPDGRISQGEAEAIFAINGNLHERDPAWVHFFVEAMGEYVVNQASPRGYVSQDNADWLVAQIDADGAVCSMAELETLVRVLEVAKNVPHSLKDYAAAQIEKAVMKGTGPTRDGGRLEAGNVNATEARLLRRMLFAPAGDGPGVIGPDEAELLFRLKDATLGADNAPEWKQLFVQGVANYLECWCGENAQLDRERAAQLEAFMDDRSHGVGRFFARMATASPNMRGAVFGKRESGPSFDEKIAAAKSVTPDEQAWLDAKVSVDGEVDEYEQALLDFLAEG